MLTNPVTLEVDDLSIAGRLYLPDGRRPRPTVCVCHGIPAGRLPDPADGGYPLLAETICREGLAVFIFNFRGTGASGGNFDITGWTRDLKAAVKEVVGTCMSMGVTVDQDDPKMIIREIDEGKHDEYLVKGRTEQ